MQADHRTPRSYVIYATMPFDGPWNVEHNVAHALAEHHRVLYVDPPQSPATPFRHGPGRVSWPAIASVLDRRVRRSGRLSVFGPLALPPLTHRAMHAASTPLVRAQISRAVRMTGLERPVAVGWRSLHEYRGAAGEALRVGVVMDDLPAAAGLLGRDPADLEREMDETCAASDLLCATSPAVQELLARRGWPAELLRFGFAADLAPLYDNAVAPPEYGALGRPLLGYTGSVDDRLDFDLIAALADRFPGGSLLFVGAVSPRLSEQARGLLASRPNIHVLGVRPRNQLPAYISFLDCALLPYRDTRFTRSQSPMKLWDYLYSGVPIVGTGSADLAHYPAPLVSFALDPVDAPELVAAAVAGSDAGRERRRAYALQNSWAARAAQLDALVDRAQARAPAPAALAA